MTTVTRPVAECSALDEHFHHALGEGRLVFQRTDRNACLPPRAEDPVTLSPAWEWVAPRLDLALRLDVRHDDGQWLPTSGPAEAAW